MRDTWGRHVGWASGSLAPVSHWPSFCLTRSQATCQVRNQGCHGNSQYCSTEPPLATRTRARTRVSSTAWPQPSDPRDTWSRPCYSRVLRKQRRHWFRTCRKPPWSWSGGWSLLKRLLNHLDDIFYKLFSSTSDTNSTHLIIFVHQDSLGSGFLIGAILNRLNLVIPGQGLNEGSTQSSSWICSWLSFLLNIF